MKIRSRYLVYPFLFGMSVFIQAQVISKSNKSAMAQQDLIPQPKEIVLDALQAKGGSIIKTDQWSNAVLFPAANPIGDKITWTIPSSLPSGLWQIDIDFYQPDGAFSPNQILSFEAENGEKLGALDFYYIGLIKGTYTKSIGFYSPKAASVISFMKSAQRNTNTVAIRAIRIVPASESALKNLMFVFQLQVKGSQVKLPVPLPSGLYIVNTTKPVALNWVSPDKGTFSTPLAREIHVFLDKPSQPFISSDEVVNDIQLTHYPTLEEPDMSRAGNGPIMVASDSSKFETGTLKLIGYKGLAIPKLDLFPGGKTMALVTSWDDGNVKDLQVMEMLLKYGMKGTFFMNRNSQMIPRLRELEVKGMEIGSHSWSHPPLYNSTPKRVLDELVEMRRFLEKEVQHPVISFAYPFNYQPAYDADGNYVLRSMRKAGYWSGRATTTGDNSIDSIPEPLAMRPNFHFKVGAVKTKEKLEQQIQKPGSILYIWGHSYELAGDGEKILEEVLSTVANRPEVWYTDLGELMIWQFIRNHLLIEPNSNTKNEREFIFKLPWLNPYLRQKVPFSVSIQEGVKEVLWQGKKIPVVNGNVQLIW
jgi:peptidoglycan/xylan/chitin deacetylase (PgdA/CDA1 family)